MQLSYTQFNAFKQDAQNITSVIAKKREQKVELKITCERFVTGHLSRITTTAQLSTQHIRMHLFAFRRTHTASLAKLPPVS